MGGEPAVGGARWVGGFYFTETVDGIIPPTGHGELPLGWGAFDLLSGAFTAYGSSLGGVSTTRLLAVSPTPVPTLDDASTLLAPVVPTGAITTVAPSMGGFVYGVWPGFGAVQLSGAGSPSIESLGGGSPIAEREYHHPRAVFIGTDAYVASITNRYADLSPCGSSVVFDGYDVWVTHYQATPAAIADMEANRAFALGVIPLIDGTIDLSTQWGIYQLATGTLSYEWVASHKVWTIPASELPQVEQGAITMQFMGGVGDVDEEEDSPPVTVAHSSLNRSISFLTLTTHADPGTISISGSSGWNYLLQVDDGLGLWQTVYYKTRECGDNENVTVDWTNPVNGVVVIVYYDDVDIDDPIHATDTHSDPATPALFGYTPAGGALPFPDGSANRMHVSVATGGVATFDFSVAGYGGRFSNAGFHHPNLQSGGQNEQEGIHYTWVFTGGSGTREVVSWAAVLNKRTDTLPEDSTWLPVTLAKNDDDHLVVMGDGRIRVLDPPSMSLVASGSYTAAERSPVPVADSNMAIVDDDGYFADRERVVRFNARTAAIISEVAQPAVGLSVTRSVEPFTDGVVVTTVDPYFAVATARVRMFDRALNERFTLSNTAGETEWFGSSTAVLTGVYPVWAGVVDDLLVIAGYGGVETHDPVTGGLQDVHLMEHTGPTGAVSRYGRVLCVVEGPSRRGWKVGSVAAG